MPYLLPRYNVPDVSDLAEFIAKLKELTQNKRQKELVKKITKQYEELLEYAEELSNVLNESDSADEDTPPPYWNTMV